MSTLYARTESTVTALEAALAKEGGPAPAGQARVALHDATVLVLTAAELEPAVVKMKTAADETDPNKKTYGAGMVAKVLALHARFVAVAEAAAHAKARHPPAYAPTTPQSPTPCSTATCRRVTSPAITAAV
jgi:hypothetical protein